MFEHVLIFGGTGSLGTMIIKMWQGKVNRFTVFTRDEYKQWALKQQFPRLNIHFVLGDISDKEKVYQTVVSTNPTLIIVASAMKHVERCEENVRSCLLTNSFGLLNIVESISTALAQQVPLNLKKLLMVSTDKACAPINVYGMSKSICEHIVQNTSIPGIDFICVRYGNVVNSNGSIIPLLKKQALDPSVKEFTLTDTRMTRFYMTLEDSVNLIEDCVRYAKNGEIWIPKLDSMTIMSLIEIFSESYGKPINIVGIRPGEKIHESLISSHESLRTYETMTQKGVRYVITPKVIENNPTPVWEYSSENNIIPKDKLRLNLMDYLNVKFSTTIVVLGSGGMLGGYITRYFRPLVRYEVIAISRKELEVSDKLTVKNLSEFLTQKVGTFNNQVIVINCIGLTNKVSGNFQLINSVFPRMVNTVCECHGWIFIQPSTDCAFSGKRQIGFPYTEVDDADEKGDYGRSKIEGECGMTIRLSIIGHDSEHKRGLLEFVKANDDIQGYTNHIWTGVTCIEYAKILDQIIRKNLFWVGIRHIVPPYVVTKAELIRAIIKTNGWHKNVTDVEDYKPNNKQLATIYPLDVTINSLEQQLLEL